MSISSPLKSNAAIDDSDTDDGKKPLTDPSISKHYEVPNLSSVLYEYTNNERDRIKRGFQPGNYISLRDLPNSLLPGNVSLINASRVQSNLYNSQEERSYIELQKGGGYFSKFEWIPDPYELFAEEMTRRR